MTSKYSEDVIDAAIDGWFSLEQYNWKTRCSDRSISEFRAQMEAALKAVDSMRICASGWRPMDTASADGNPVRLYCEPMNAEARPFHSIMGYNTASGWGDGILWRAIAWQPLDDPPSWARVNNPPVTAALPTIEGLSKRVIELEKQVASLTSRAYPRG